MDNPGQSLFQGNDIKINNSQNNEEEEDLEDQKRRKEELQNLLTAALDDFNYDESTVNSSANLSGASVESSQLNNRNTVEPNEQLKVLYDVRVREINNLKEEYENFKVENNKENDNLKRKLLLFEADTRQLQISLKNAEELLVEKASNIKELKEEINIRDAQIQHFQKTVENFQMEICSYQSTINEMQLNLQSDLNPFGLGAKKFNSEQLQKAHQDQINSLEALLEEQTRKANIIEKEKLSLQNELEHLATEKKEMEFENQNMVQALTKTMESAQQQCRDLLDVVEMLNKENYHFKERINDINNQELDKSSPISKSMDVPSLLNHLERLKKMLVDKSIQIETANSKLKHYENDLKEVLEYRQLRADVYKKEFQTCENKDHLKSLILMQNDVQNYRRTIDDKNQQILVLNSTNRDLQEKIEEMLLQTRNEIQNLSHKYSLPQLEQMTEELRNAEEQVQDLQEKLQKSEERHLELVQKIQKAEKNQEKNITNSKEEKDIKHLEQRLKKTLDDLEMFSKETLNLRQFTEELISENTRLKLNLKKSAKLNTSKDDSEKSANTSIKQEYEQLKQQLDQVKAHLQKNKHGKDGSESVLSLKKDMDGFVTSFKADSNKLFLKEKISDWKQKLDEIQTEDPDKHLKEQFKEAIIKLKTTEEKLKESEIALQDLSDKQTIVEGEKRTCQSKVKVLESKLDEAKQEVKLLENKMENLKAIIENQRKALESKDLNKINAEKAEGEVEKLKGELLYKEYDLKTSEKNKKEVSELLQVATTQLEKKTQEVLALQNELSRKKDCSVRKNLQEELKEAEDLLERSRLDDGDVLETEHFKMCLQAELLKNELKLRDDLQQEYFKKLKEIEAKYNKSYSSSTERYKVELEKLKNQESRYREYLANILTECGNRIDEYEAEKRMLLTKLNNLQSDYDKFKKNSTDTEENYKKFIKKTQLGAKKNGEEWKGWSKKFMGDCLKIETVSKKSRDHILTEMNHYDSEIAQIEKTYKDKVRKYFKSNKF